MFEPRYLEANGRSLFTLLRAPEGCRQLTLIVPPFGDEWAKCRPSISNLCKKLASLHQGVLIVDLSGTGDSGGHLRDVVWTHWLQDLQATATHYQQAGYLVDQAVAIRTGALLLSELQVKFRTEFSKSVLWQPVDSGKAYLRQLLRMRVMQQKVTFGRNETVPDLMGAILSGQTVVAAGLELTAPLVAPMIEAANASPPTNGHPQWRINVKRGAVQSLPVAELLDYENGGDFEIDGEPYWSSTETVINKLLIELTASLLGHTQQRSPVS